MAPRREASQPEEEARVTSSSHTCRPTRRAPSSATVLTTYSSCPAWNQVAISAFNSSSRARSLFETLGLNWSGCGNAVAASGRSPSKGIPRAHLRELPNRCLEVSVVHPVRRLKVHGTPHQAPGAAYADFLMMSMAVAATYPSVGPSPRAVCQMASTSSTSPIVR
jgi:hypothetical protein